LTLLITEGLPVLVSGNDAIVRVTKEDSGGVVEISMGQTLQIDLPGIPGTGYWWHFTELDSNYLEVVGEAVQEPSAETRLGGPAVGVWKLRPKARGTTQVRMGYFRVWEGPGSATDHFALEVQISTR